MKNLEKSFTFRLFKKTSNSPFIEGMASILGTPEPMETYNYDNTDSEADMNSIRSDWLQVGEDLRGTMLKYGSSKTPGSSN